MVAADGANVEFIDAMAHVRAQPIPTQLLMTARFRDCSVSTFNHLFLLEIQSF